MVGAGPAGSAAAYYLAQAGLDVLLLEKSRFPREKVCGDGLTPRGGQGAGRDGHPHQRGGRLAAEQGPADHRRRLRLELPWPELSSYPGYGLVRTRLDFDELLARRAQKAGARLIEGVTVTGPVLDDDRPDHRRDGAPPAGGRIASPGAEPNAATARRVVVAADGNSSRLSVAMGLRKRDDRPIGVAVRTYYTSPGTTTITSSRGSTCGTATGCCPATAGSSAWATAPATSASAC